MVAISEPAPTDAVAHLLEFDSAHGRLGFPVQVDGSRIKVAQYEIQTVNEANESSIDWAALGADLLIDCSGQAATPERGERLIEQGVTRVLFSHPGSAELDRTVVVGFNDELLQADDRLISNASCSTNCIVPVLEMLDREFTVQFGVTNTIHSAMHDQPVIDAFHSSDLRKTRSALNSIIPVDTALEKGIDRMLPSLAGKFKCTALRVPTVNVSAIDLTVAVDKAVSIEQVTEQLEKLAKKFPSVVAISNKDIVSCDLNHDSHSVIVDANLTQVSGNLIKLHLWFDNEWAYATRMTDVARIIANFGTSTTRDYS